MSYHVHVTKAAKQDLFRTADYIDINLKNPAAADRLFAQAKEKMLGLGNFPQKFPVIDDPVLSSWGIRYLVIHHYLAFYVVDDASQTVDVVRFLYGKSNWCSILKEGFSLD